jgi:hypothetical protein
MVLVRERTIPTERPPLVGEAITNFCGYRVPLGQRVGSLRSYSRFSKQKPLVFYQVAFHFTFLIKLTKHKIVLHSRSIHISNHFVYHNGISTSFESTVIYIYIDVALLCLNNFLINEVLDVN